jgi:hypothetical protein
VSDESASGEASPAPDPRGPLVAPGLVPAIEQPAHRKPAPLWQSVGVALLVLAVLAWGMAWINDRWGDAARLETAANAFRALTSGDADGFLALVDADVGAGLKRSDLLANERLGRSLRWEALRFVGGAARLVVRSGSTPPGVGVATFTPDPDGRDLVRMTASGGPLGEATGTMQLVRELGGWRLIGFQFHQSAVPTTAPPAK